MRNKLKENRGITIIHALVGVLIFGVISSIIYSSAMANLKSLNSESKFQQAYLTVSSAAEAIVEGLDGDYAYYEIGYRENYSSYIGFIPSSFKYMDFGMKNALYDTDSDDHVVGSDMKTMYITPSIVKKTRNFTITASNGSDSLENVRVEYCMTNDYTIYMNLYIVDSDGNPAIDNYYMCVRIPVGESDVEKLHDKDYSAKALKIEKFTTRKDNELGFRINRKAIYHITYNAKKAEFNKGKYDFTKF